MITEYINLNKFTPRPYQYPLFDALENKGYNRIIAVLPRRAGKDVCAWNLIIRAALRKVGVYYYIFPFYSQAKKALWDSLTNEGESFLSYIPEQLIARKNRQEMSIMLTNSSVIQLLGSAKVDHLVGTNPRGIVFSEYALQDPNAYIFLSPALRGNDGFAVFISTPRAKNHLWDMLQMASREPDWFCYVRSIEETKHIPLEVIEKERKEKILSEDMIQQEYYCSFDMGVEGSYYSRYINKMRLDDRISSVPYESGFPVHTSWDLGMKDETTIVFFQCVGTTVRIIDCYENSGHGLEHYAKVLHSKDYLYGTHIAPHDIKVRELGTGVSRLETARRMKIPFMVAPDVSVADGIESVRLLMGKLWIDDKRCNNVVKALENYRQEWDERRKVYKGYPLHNWASHFADNIRYLAISLPKLSEDSSAEELEKRYRAAVYGQDSSIPSFFRDTPRY